jgi:hypothetical protein
MSTSNGVPFDVDMVGHENSVGRRGVCYGGAKAGNLPCTDTKTA